MATKATAIKFWHRPIVIRISVRALIVLVLAVGGGLGWFLHRAKVRRDLVAAINRSGGRVYYDRHLKINTDHDKPPQLYWGISDVHTYHDDAPWPAWLVSLVGIDALGTVTQVYPGPKLDDGMFAAIGKLDHLESLIVTDAANLTDAMLAHLRGKARLKELVLGVYTYNGPPQMTGAGLGHLEGCTSLEMLRITGVTRLADADLAHLSRLTELRTLALSDDGRSTVTDEGLAHLGSLRKLRHFSISGNMAITDEGLAHLEPLRDLRDLSVSGNMAITNAGLAHLGKLTGLESLSLGLNQITDLKGLEPLVGLKTLILDKVPIDDRGFAALADLRSLRSLLIYHDPALTDAGMVHFRGLADLEVLFAGSPRITDAGLECLWDCRKLERLILNGTQVADEGLLMLVKRKEYDEIGVMGTKVTAAGIKAAMAVRPNKVIQGP